MAMLAGAATVSTATVGAGTAGATGTHAPLKCDVLYAVNTKDSNAYLVNPANGAKTTDFKLGTSSPNQLGIAAGGTYAVYTDSNKIYKYDALKDSTSNKARPSGYASQHGAINPKNGMFYFGGYDNGGFKYAVYNPETEAVVPGDVKVTIVPDEVTGDTKPTKDQTNGDIAFDAAGNMYIVSSSSNNGLVYSVTGPVNAGSNLTGKAITKKTTGFGNATSAAFGPGGYLYAGRTNGDLIKIDPRTGDTVESMKTVGMYDLGSCSDPYTIELSKDLPAGRAAEADQFKLEVTGGGVSTGNTATTTGNASGVQPDKVGPLLGLAGTTYTIKESATNGADLANYEVSWQCVDAKTNGKLASGDGTTGTVTISSGQSGKSVNCTFINKAKKLELTKSVSPSDAKDFKVGQVLTYTFTMKNTGAVPLTDVTPVEKEFTGFDEKVSDFTCSDKLKKLNPGDTAECTATYTIAQGDINKGAPIDNTAYATGTDPGGNPVKSKDSTVTITGGAAATGIALEKTAEPKSGVKIGDTVTYEFAITNTGEQTLTDVKVKDNDFNASDALSDIDCPKDPLEPGKSVTCKATYVFTDKDMNAGSIKNTATAEGTPPNGADPIESKPSTVTVTGDPQTGLELVKTADRQSGVKAGDTITYQFAVKNTGEQTLTGVDVKDNDFSGTGGPLDISCPNDPLAPGASVTCKATYVVTDEDVTARSIRNVAMAVGTPPNEADPIESNQSEVTVKAEDPAPGGNGSLGSLGAGSLGSLGTGSLGSLAVGSLGAGSLAAGSLAAGSLAQGSNEGSGSAGSSNSSGSAGSNDAGSAGSNEAPGSNGSNGSGTPGGSNGSGGEKEAGTPGTPGTPADSEKTGNGGNSGNQGATGNSDTESGALIDSGLGADSDGGMNAGLIAGGLMLLVAAGGVLLFALRRRNQGNE